MRTEKIIWGLVLVFAGGVLLLHNFNLINFYWPVLFRFWPLILILIGANLLFSKEGSRAGAIISVFLTILALGFITYKGVTTSDRHSSWSFNNKEPEQKSYSNIFSETYSNSIKRAVLNVSGGATQYVLKDTTDDLFFADVKSSFGKYSLLKTFQDSLAVLNFKMKGHWNSNDHDDNDIPTVIKLNSRPLWDVNLKIGAGETDFDLSPFKISNLVLEGGAGSFKIRLGIPVQTTSVAVKTGASEIAISIPRSVGCKINVKSGLSSNDFNDFIEQPDGSWSTENFNRTTKKVLINLKGGLSDFQVKRY